MSEKDDLEVFLSVCFEYQRIDTPEFEKWWFKWLKYRRTELHKRATPRTQKMHLKKLNAMGPTRAIAAIKHSRDHGWVGIFEPGDNRAKQHVETSARIR